MAAELQPQFDRLVHEPSRLAILAYLASREASTVGFTELKSELGMTAGNLSVHLKNLEEAGYVEITKSFVENKPNTSVRLTVTGSRALSTYLAQMESLIQTLKKES